MQTSVTFKKIDSSEALKSYIQKKVSRFDKMLDSPAEASVVLSVEKIRHIAEITLTCDKLKIHAREESDNMYSSIDILMDKVKTQITKSKEKLRKHMSGNKQSIKSDDTELADSSEPQLITENTREVVIEAIDFKPLDIDDAVLEFKSGKEAFLVFNNARTEAVNVLYKRADGTLGLIQPRR